MYQTNELRFIEFKGKKILQQKWKYELGEPFNPLHDVNGEWRDVPFAGVLKTDWKDRFNVFKIKVDEWEKIRKERDNQVRIAVCDEIIGVLRKHTLCYDPIVEHIRKIRNRE